MSNKISYHGANKAGYLNASASPCNVQGCDPSLCAATSRPTIVMLRVAYVTYGMVPPNKERIGCQDEIKKLR